MSDIYTPSVHKPATKQELQQISRDLRYGCSEEQLEAITAYLNENIDIISNTAVMNLTGHPALTLPLGKLGDGRTDSLMIVGKHFDELTVLQVARALEKIIQAKK